MESTELQLYTLPKSTKELETAFISEDFTDKLIESIREKAKSVVGDISTAKGRKAYISMAATVRSSKVAIDEAGKTLVAEMKKRPALVDASRRKIREALDDLAIEIREPVTQWEAEQERIKAEEKFYTDHLEALEMNAAFDKALAERIKADHEIALLMNEKLDRDREEQARLAEQARIENENRIAREAAEKASREAEEKAEREREEALKRELAIKLENERLEREKEAAIKQAELDKKLALEKAEQEKQAAIQAEIKKAEDAEQARLAEAQRKKDEETRRANDIAHKKSVNQAALKALVKEGLPEDCAKQCITAIALNKIPNLTIKY